MADPDAALMLALQRGDESAFATLVGRHRERVLRLAYRYLGDETSAEDLAQESFIRVYRARLSWRPTAKFSTWLYRVTANACLNEIRARRARRTVEATAPVDPRPGHEGEPALEAADHRSPGPDQAALDGERARVVREAVQALPDDQRLAVLLNKYEGLGYREIADAMDRSVPAVKSLLVRARENLRRSLARFVRPPERAARRAGEDATENAAEKTRKSREDAR